MEERQSIEAATAAHKSIIANKAWHEAEEIRNETDDNVFYTTVRLDYSLRSGRTVSREYGVRYSHEIPGDVGLVQTVLNCPEAVSDRKETNFPITEENIYDSSITTVMTAADCAAAAGYDSAEEYVLREYCGVSGSELDVLDETMREEMLRDAVFRYSQGGYMLEKNYAAIDYAPGTGESVPVLIDTGVSEDDVMYYDLDQVLFNYAWLFTPKQMMELYETCILPDITDNTLGRVWLITDETYRDTVYDTEIRISARNPIPDSEGREPYDYADFYTVPTVDSARTNAWLASHGVTQYTLSEIEEICG